MIIQEEIRIGFYMTEKKYTKMGFKTIEDYGNR